MNKNFILIGKDHHGMDMVECCVVDIKDNTVKAYISTEDGKEKIYFPLSKEDGFFFLQDYGKKHNIKVKITNGLKPTIENFKKVEKLIDIFADSVEEAGTYLRHVGFKTEDFWSVWENKFDFSKVPLEVLMEYIKEWRYKK